MNKFVSIDSSTTSTGMCLWVNNKLTKVIVHQPKADCIEDRMYKMANLICATLDLWKPEEIYAETPQGHGANVKLARNLGEMLGVIMGWAASNECGFTEVNPSTWRKWNGWEQGKLTRPELKALSIEKAMEINGIDCGKCDDLADAINIGNGVLKHFG